MTIGYSQKEAARFSEVPANTVQLWARDGLIRASVQETTGTGVPRLYSGADIVRIKVIKMLTDHSSNRKLVKRFCEFLDAKHSGRRTWGDEILDPMKINPNDLSLIKFTSDRWTYVEGLQKDEKINGTVLRAMTAAEFIGDDATGMWINLNAVKAEISAKLR